MSKNISKALYVYKVGPPGYLFVVHFFAYKVVVVVKFNI